MRRISIDYPENDDKLISSPMDWKSACTLGVFFITEAESLSADIDAFTAILMGAFHVHYIQSP